MAVLTVVVCSVLCAWIAEAFEHEEKSYHESSHHHESYVFHGVYKGKCGKDGLYWRDHSSLIICTHGTAYVQPCAPGTRNSESRFEHGHTYGKSDFCNVNLVDYGYAATYRQTYPEHPKVEEHVTGYDAGHQSSHGHHKVQEHVSGGYDEGHHSTHGHKVEHGHERGYHGGEENRRGEKQRHNEYGPHHGNNEREQRGPHHGNNEFRSREHGHFRNREY